MTEMTNYLSTTKFESKLLPGLVYSLRKMSHGRRVKINLSAAKQLARMTELQRQLGPVMEELGRAEEAAKLQPCQCSHSLEPSDPIINARVGAIAELNAKILATGGKIVEIVDICHTSTTKRCIVEGCPCRKPMPDESIGGYDKQQELIQGIMDIEDQELIPIWIRGVVAEVQGLMIDGEPATADSILEVAPEEITAELSREVKRIMRLTADEALGFKSPTTSDAVEVGQAVTTAP